MLSKFFLRAAVTAAALTCTTGSASAEEYRILMMDYAFFPEINYVQPGDTVIFENASGEMRDVAAEDGSWIIAGMADGSETAMSIVAGMPNRFQSLVPGGEGDEVDENGNVAVVGILNFSGQPAGVQD
ncbi:hypothetical protein [uncultured Sulfitobacter sp.]|uniref:cupredoxin domain-containing protein n=1 Tax=uncultured Sulfitobacter sp. TaxID=191468 RepID=UPI0026292376|nr:hypothetical protein [uncultured Sulfitobacter sp.]